MNIDISPKRKPSSLDKIRQQIRSEIGSYDLVLITEELLEKGKSINGGWNLQQVEALGFNGWESKWKKRAIGKYRSEIDVKIFLDLKDKHTKGMPKKAKAIHFETVTKNIPYADQYKHPNWQKMRLLVFKRDGFKCVNCHDKDSLLHVHHLKYKTGKNVWEVPHWYLVTLCDVCHGEEHGKKF